MLNIDNITVIVSTKMTALAQGRTFVKLMQPRSNNNSDSDRVDRILSYLCTVWPFNVQ